MSRQNVQILTKMYKFLAKMKENVPITYHGKENVNLILCRELLARKKFDFLTQGILPRPQHALT